MNGIILRILTRLRAQHGQGTAEYVLISAAVVAVVAGIVWATLQVSLGGAIESLGSKIATAITGL